MAKKETKDLTVEEKLKLLYQLQVTLSAIDEKRALRGELPNEVQDLEDELEGLNTRVERIENEIAEFKNAVVQKQGRDKGRTGQPGALQEAARRCEEQPRV